MVEKSVFNGKLPYIGMTRLLVNVKWGKELLSDIELDKSQDVMTFKAILYALSNVPVDKQKIMIKGKMLKDTDDLSKFDIVDGMTLMMMGAAEGKTL
jgi:ubiquitin carboxyl-terminal hydrolase 14